jgi:hypothetical protein
MNAWATVARALPLTFLIYVAQACAAWVAGFGPVLELSRHLPLDSRPLSQAVWLEGLLASVATLRASAITLGLTCLLLLLVSPGLHMAWLAALDAPTRPLRSLAQGTRLWLRGALVSLWVLMGLGLAALPFGLVAWGIAHWLGDDTSDRLRDLSLLCALLPLLPLAWFAHVWHDLARARALYQSSLKSTLGSLRDALRPHVQLSALGWSALALSAVLLTHWGAVQLEAPALAARVGILQGGLLLRLILRSRWLARALACADSAPGSGARYEK